MKKYKPFYIILLLNVFLLSCNRTNHSLIFTEIDGKKFISIKNYGAIGDGIHDDTKALQKAINENTNLILEKNKTYLVTKKGTYHFLGGKYPFCLQVGSNKKIHLNGATIKLANHQNAAIFLIASKDKNAVVKNVSISSGNIDGNKKFQRESNLYEMPCITALKGNRIKVYDLDVKNPRQYAGRFLGINDGYFNNLKCFDSDADGWSFGVSGKNKTVRNSTIGNIYAENCDRKYGNMQGNPAIFTVENTSINKVVSKNCGGGIKIQDATINCTIDSLIFEGGNLGTANSGIKIQGRKDINLIPENVTINFVKSSKCSGSGLFIINTRNVFINEYVGMENNPEYGRDVLLRYSDNVIVKKMRSINCTKIGVLIGVGAINYVIDSLYIENPLNVAIQIQGGEGEINSLTVCNNDLNKKLKRALKVTSGKAKGNIKNLRLDINTQIISNLDSFLEFQDNSKRVFKLNKILNVTPNN